MHMSRELRLPTWDKSTAQVAATYLSSRGFRNPQMLAGPVIRGTRGSWLGNLTSFDMTKLKATVSISPSASGALVDLDVNTRGQLITEWNVAVWRLELVELQRVLRGAGHIGEVWSRFNRAARSGAARWVMTLATGGRDLADTWEQEIAGLETTEFGTAAP